MNPRLLKKISKDKQVMDEIESIFRLMKAGFPDGAVLVYETSLGLVSFRVSVIVEEIARAVLAAKKEHGKENKKGK